jgi:hypothetical protein
LNDFNHGANRPAEGVSGGGVDLRDAHCFSVRLLPKAKNAICPFVYPEVIPFWVDFPPEKQQTIVLSALIVVMLVNISDE